MINVLRALHRAGEAAEECPDDPTAFLKALASSLPIGRLGKPEDVAKLALFLASDMADYITGEVIAVDGGMYI